MPPQITRASAAFSSIKYCVQLKLQTQLPIRTEVIFVVSYHLDNVVPSPARTPPHFLQLASFLVDVIGFCCKLLVACCKLQRCKLLVVSFIVVVIPV